MPLYEHHCLSCSLTFETLAPVAAARRPATCPRCGRRSPRVTSFFATPRSGGRSETAEAAAAAKPKPAERPLCMNYPQVPLLCHMDKPSAERFVAHVSGNGARYDDRIGAREELRKKRGEPSPGVRANGHAHGHDHGHGHSHEKAHDHTHGHDHAHGKADGHAQAHRHGEKKPHAQRLGRHSH